MDTAHCLIASCVAFVYVCVKQDRHCTYKVTLGRVRVTIVTVEKQYILVCVSVFLPYFSGMQSARAILYCNIWLVRLYSIFPHYPINGTIIGKKLLNIKRVF